MKRVLDLNFSMDSIHDTKNVIYLAISFLATFSSCRGEVCSYLTNIMTVYVFFDTFFAKNGYDLIIHHLLVMIQRLFYFFYQDSMMDMGLYEKCSMFTQRMMISSLFLTIQDILDRSSWKWGKKVIKPISEILFVGTFFYFRIYQSILFLMDQTYHDQMEVMCKGDHGCIGHYYFIYIGYYMINVYWATLILKKMVKVTGVKDSIHKIPAFYYERILNYTLIGSNIYNSFFYGWDWNFEKKRDYLIDIAGLGILSIASMYYHHTIEKMYMKKDTSAWTTGSMESDLIFWTAMDQLSIKLRSVGIIYAIYGLVPKTWGAIVIHAITYTGFALFLSCLRREEGIEIFGKKIEHGITICAGASFLYDNYVISSFDTSNIYCNYNRIISVIAMGAFFVKPFYEANQLYVHLLLVIQAWILAMINITK